MRAGQVIGVRVGSYMTASILSIGQSSWRRSDALKHNLEVLYNVFVGMGVRMWPTNGAYIVDLLNLCRHAK